MNCKKSLTRFFYFSLCLILALGILLTGCDLWELKPDSGVNGGNNTDTENGAEAELPDIFDDEEYEITDNTFSVTTDAADGYTLENNICTITAAGVYTCTGSLADGQIIVDAGDSDVVEIDLKTVEIACSYGAPVLILNADKVEISAKKDTKNIIIDKRTTCEETDETAAAIYSECDLKIKGNGELSVKTSLNNGIHTKDDLDLKNLTLYVSAPNHAIKGNDSITCENATITAVSTGGDALKTSNSDISDKGNQRGTVTVNGGSLELYACCDGIDAAYDVIITDEANVTIYTNTYSSYTTERVEKSESTMYFRFPGSGMGMRPGQSSFPYASYQYSVLFTLNDGSEVWENLSTSETIGSYIFYQVSLSANASAFCLYAYNSSQTPQSTDSYAYRTEKKNLNTSYDTFYISGISGSTLSGGWTNYSTVTSQGPGGFGGMGGGFGQEGNPNAAEFSCKGIKADNAISVESCTITVSSYDDALHANNDVLLENGSYGQGNITISSGTLMLTSKDDAIHADQDFNGIGGNLTVTAAYEGIESNRMYFNGLTAYVYASDDAVNAVASGNYNPLIEVCSGLIDLEVPSGDTDTMDSNGSIKISGGVVILKNGQSGNSMTGGTIDCDGSISVTGGIVIAIGAAGNVISGAKRNTSVSFSAGSYTLKNADGTTVAEFTLSSTHKGYMIYIGTGGTYTLYCDNNSVLNFSF